MQLSSTIRTSGSCTSTAPVGHTRTQAKHVTQADGSIEKITVLNPGAGSEKSRVAEYAPPRPDCQES